MRILFAIIFLFSFCSISKAQLIDGGKLSNDITFTDINGKAQSIYKHCRLGRNVLINFFKVGDDSSWSHHQRRAMQTFYNKYNWNNYVFMLENSGAPVAALSGPVSGSLGNWKNGANFYFALQSGPERKANQDAFYVGSASTTDTTMLCLICSDSSTYQIPYTADSAEIKNIIKSKCKFFEEGLLYIEDDNIKTNVTAKDLNDSTISFVEQISLKKTIIVSFIKGNQTEDWKYNDKKYLQDYYLAYEKFGPKDSRVLFMDVDEKSTNSDLNGFGTVSPGSWGRYNDFSVSNLDSFDAIKNVMDAFIRDGVMDTTAKIKTPLCFVVCSDNKVYRFDTSYNKQQIRDIVTTKCFKWALGVTSTENHADFYLSEDGFIYFESANEKSKDFSFTVYNSLGQELYRTDRKNAISMQDLHLSRGLYIFNLNENGRASSKKVIF